MKSQVAPPPIRLRLRPERSARYAKDSGDTKTGNDKDLSHEQDNAGNHQQDLLPAGELDQPVPPEEKRDARNAENSRHAEAGRANFQNNSEHTDGDQKRTDNRMGEKADKILRPVGRCAPHFGPGKS